MTLTRRQATFGLGGLGAAGLAGCDGAGGTQHLYSAEILPADFPTTLAVEHMGKLLKERSGGRFDIKVYSGAQLGSERDTLEITIMGGLDMNRTSAAPLNSIAPITLAPCLPFVFRSIPHMRAAMDSRIGREILDGLEPYGMMGLCFYDSGARSFYNTRGPIHTPEDLKGLKIRVQNSDLFVAMVSALGADATPMPFGDVYQGLVQGVIDGAENNWPSYEATRHFETARYYSLTRHVMAPEVLVMSRHRWRSLSEADQELVLACAADSVPMMRDLWDARVQAARDTIAATDVEVNEVEDVAQFSALMEPVWDRFLTTPQQRRLVDEIQDLEVGSSS